MTLTNMINVNISTKSVSKVHIENVGNPCLNKLIQNIRPEEALKRISLLFNQCGISHQVVGLTAIETALGYPFNPQLNICRAFLTKLESLYQSLWLAFIDLPKLVNIPIDWEFFKQVTYSLTLQMRNAENSLVLCLSPNQQQINHFSHRFLDVEFKEQFSEQLNLCRSRFQCAKGLVDLTQEIKQADWKVNSQFDLSNIKLEGYINRHIDIVNQSEYRLLGLFKAMQADLIMQTTDLLNTIDNLFKKQFLQDNKHDNSVGLLSSKKFDTNYNANLDVLSGSARLEIARGSLDHKISLTRSKKDNLLMHSWQISAPTEHNFSKGKVAEQCLYELLKTDVPNSQFIQKAELLLKLLNPCYLFKVTIDNSAIDISEKKYA